MLWTALAAAALFGLIMLALGLRGRAIDDHPVCRRCRFDLVGVYPKSQRCPECGADVGGRKGIRIGNRKRRPRIVACGAGLLGLSVLLGSAAGIITARGIDTYPYRPLWALRLEARHGSEEGSAAAVGEVIRRLNDRPLPERRLASLISRALERQGDREAVWDPLWGDLVETAWLLGAVSGEHWKQYLQQIVVISITPRSPVRVGDYVPYIVHQEFRVGGRLPVAGLLNVEVPALDGTRGTVEPSPERRGRIPDDPLIGMRIMHPVLRYRPMGQTTGTPIHPPDFHGLGRPMLITKWPRAAEHGTSELRAYVDVWLFDEFPRIEGLEGPSDYLARYMVEATAPVEVVDGEDAAPIELVHDDAMARTIQAGLTAPNGVQVTQRPHTHVHVMFQFGELPVPIAFDAFLHADGREWFIGRVVSNSGRGGGRGTSCVVPELDLEITNATLILRPSPDAARETPDLWEIFGHELIVEDVPVMVR